MSIWIDRFKNHAVWGRFSTLGAAIDQAVQREDIDAPSLDGIERLRTVLGFAGKRLAGADPALVCVPPLDDLANALQNAETEIQAFVADGIAAHVGNANTHADNALTQLPRLVVPLTPDDTGALKDAAVGYRDAIETQLKLVGASFSRAREEIDGLKSKLTELTAEITAERTRLTAMASEFQAQFSSAQDSRGKEHTDAQSVRQEKFGSLLTDYQTKLTEQNAESAREREATTKAYDAHVAELTSKYAASATAILDEMDKQKGRVEKLVGVIGNLGVTSGYLRSANQARWTTWFWQAMTVGSLGLLIWFAYHAFLPVLNSNDGHAAGQPSGFSWSSFAARVLVTVAVGILAAYTRSQGDKYLDTERRNRKLALEFEALGPYLAPLPQAKQDEFRLAVGDRSFGRDDLGGPKSPSPATMLDLLGADQFKELITTIVKATK